jgi:predicted nuclease with TOPRIM domain
MSTAPLLPDFQPDAEALADLERRVERIVELVGVLRQEKEALRRQAETAFAEREAAQQALQAALADNRKLHVEIESLRGERTQVRQRIEKLLGQIDQLAAS